MKRSTDGDIVVSANRVGASSGLDTRARDALINGVPLKNMSVKAVETLSNLVAGGRLRVAINDVEVTATFKSEDVVAFLHALTATSKRPIVLSIPFQTEFGDHLSQAAGAAQAYSKFVSLDPKALTIGVLQKRAGSLSLPDQAENVISFFRDKPMLVFGGQHHLTYYLIKARYSEPIDLVMLDAHHDQYVLPKCRFELFNHANFVTRLMRENRLNSLVLIGARDRSPPWIGSDFESCPVLRVGVDSIDDAASKISEFYSIVGCSQLHLTIDVDVCDPAEVSDVTSPLPNGISRQVVFRTARAIMDHCGQRLNSIDISEACSGASGPSDSVEIAAKLGFELCEAFSDERWAIKDEYL